jgi:hypothetical protein
MRQQSRQISHVVFTVFKNGGTFRSTKRRALQDPIPHFFFVSSIDGVVEKITQSTG